MRMIKMRTFHWKRRNVGICVVVCVVSLYIAASLFLSSESDPTYISGSSKNKRRYWNRVNLEDRSYPRGSNLPIIVWWSDLTKDEGSVKYCDEYECYFTANRSYKNHHQTEAFMFYGTDMKFYDMPLPRQPKHRWAVLHEESPKNNWPLATDDLMVLFNHTATFSRYSDYPVTLQWLTSIEDVESRKYYLNAQEKNKYLGELAPIAFIQSDCSTPSDRDSLVKLLNKRVKIDSYGGCLHNKDLPPHLRGGLRTMEHADLYTILSHYKFVIAAENALCNDYITEKFWRSFYVGTVPIVMGSPTIRDWLPTTESAIIVDEHETLDDLVAAINRLNDDEDLYNQAISYKVDGVSNPRLLEAMRKRDYYIQNQGNSFIEGFECHVCRAIHQQKGQEPQPPALKEGRGLKCPIPHNYIPSKDMSYDNNYMYKSVALEAGFQAAGALKFLSVPGVSSLDKKTLDDFARGKYLDLVNGRSN